MYLCVRHLHFFLKKIRIQCFVESHENPPRFSLQPLPPLPRTSPPPRVFVFGGSEANRKEKRQHKSNIFENKRVYDGECGFKPR